MPNLPTPEARARYWRQRALSAEGHLFPHDMTAAAKALYATTLYSRQGLPFEQLNDAQRAHLFRLVEAVVVTISAERARRQPKDSTP